jgi:hypothetical protein
MSPTLSSNVSSQRKRWLDRNLLIAVLALGCAVMSAISVQQARTIEIQRSLIHELYQDSIQLGAMRLQHRPARHLD